jgi:hypothetical protein
MHNFSNSTDRLMSISLAIGQYPILSDRIRSQMRSELFKRGIIKKKDFEAEIREKAIQSQVREGLSNPIGEEAAETWELRLARIRDQYTDLLFSQHLSFDLFQKIVTVVLGEQGIAAGDLSMDFNPELAPQELIFEHAWTILRLPPAERAKYEHNLEECKVVLIRTMISDQLRYINIAKRWFTLTDLAEIRKRKIGAGRIGGKAAGMLLAHRILTEELGENAANYLNKPEYYFIGSNEQYSFMSMNNLEKWNNQKYKNEEEMQADYPKILKEFERGDFPSDILEKLKSLLLDIGRRPLIVRSSSLLEDSFGTSFAGKYESIFLPNQADFEENLKQLTRAITHVYGTTLNPSALMYRRAKGLQDYDERMAILIMLVEGESYHQYYFPDAAGVAFSRNLYRWAPQIKREDGFVRMVCGLGTRAVDRVGNDFPRIIALSHPLLRPTTNPETIQRCSQQFIDLIDLKENKNKTLPAREVIEGDYPPLRYLAQLCEDGYFAPLQSRLLESERSKVVLTFDELIRRTSFADQMKQQLKILEKSYQTPVDMEFTVRIDRDPVNNPHVKFTILQCRPQSQLTETAENEIPAFLPEKDIIFSTHFMVPQGVIQNLNYVVFIPPDLYFKNRENQRLEIARLIGKLNTLLKSENFIFVGPGRWGSSNADLGVPVGYSDIYHAKALIELAGKNIGHAPEPSLGTHFFQDLLEAQIYPLAIMLDEEQNSFQSTFFYHLPNHLNDFVKTSESMAENIRVLRISDYRSAHHLKVIMNNEKSLAVGFIEPD